MHVHAFDGGDVVVRDPQYRDICGQVRSVATAGEFSTRESSASHAGLGRLQLSNRATCGVSDGAHLPVASGTSVKLRGSLLLCLT